MGLPSLDFDFRAEAEFMRAEIYNAMNQGYCIIIDPSRKIVTRDIVSGATTVVQFPIDWGITRIQPLRTPLLNRQQTHDTKTRVVQFWRDYPKDLTIPDIRPGHEIIVTDGGNDPQLRNYQYVVNGALNSSMAWQRTIDAISDLERVPDYQWAYAVGNLVNGSGDLVSNIPYTISYEDPKNPGTYLLYYTSTASGAFVIPIVGYVNYHIDFTGHSTINFSPSATGNTDLGNVVIS